MEYLLECFGMLSVAEQVVILGSLFIGGLVLVGDIMSSDECSKSPKNNKKIYN